MTYFAAASLVALAILIAVAAVLVWNKGPLRGRVSELEADLQALLNRGLDRGFLVIKPGPGEEFLQFTKYIKPGKHIGLEFSFPLAPWSETYYDGVGSLLRDQGVPFDRQTVDGSDQGEVSEFLVVDFGEDFAQAASIAQDCLSTLFRHEAGQEILLHYWNVSPNEERICE